MNLAEYSRLEGVSSLTKDIGAHEGDRRQESLSGLQIGVQFMRRFGEECTLIRLASSLDQAMPWRD